MPGPTSSFAAPLQTPHVCPHPADAPLPPPRGSQPNPEAETVSAYTGVLVRPHPRSPRTPTSQDYEDPPRPTTATSPHDPITHTHHHTSSQGHCPAHGQWWQRCTQTQLLELRKWARAEPTLEGLVHRPCRGSAENCRLQPAGGWMPRAAWEAMLADALHQQGIHPHNLLEPQDHPYVLKRLPETLQVTRREIRCLWDITPSPTRSAHIPSPPHKLRRTDTGSTRSAPEIPPATQRDAPDPPASSSPP